MNNIEILEEKIKIIESLCTDDCINKSTVIQPLKYAIENLIQKNKELKKKKEKDYIPKSKVKEKIEELNKRIYYLNKELAEAYIQREKLGTETELDANGQYIYNMEQERSIRHTEKYAYLKLLEEGE